ncbi:hypothetical protein [Streptosporangium saharense]|uniref:hypothetical protein n=1 Tax=Streptosporangium saharense TaxID=1706840 RepID=UPI00342D0D27
MRTFRSQRLEKLLGTQITAESLAWKHLVGLKDAKVREAADLDYKLQYGTQPSDRHKPGGDVAAMANTQGGLVIIGAKEDADAQLIDLPGDMVVNWDTFSDFKNTFGSKDPMLLSDAWNPWERIAPGPRRLILDTGIRFGSIEQVEVRTAQLHADGAGAFAMHQDDANMRPRLDGRGDDLPCCLGEQALILAVLSGIRFLARYARDYAYAGGDALIR